MNGLKRYIKMIDWINEKTGMFAGWLTTLLVINVFYDTVMRYAFNKGNIALQELEWHIFSVIFLIGAAYTLKHDGHVRVDIFYTKLTSRAKAWIDFICTFTFLIPFCLLIIYSTKGFILNSWAVGEISPDPGGLPARYILKAMIPAGFFLLLLQGIAQSFKSLLHLMGQDIPGKGR
ncbi:MAG: TRAP transporter small permease subunit [Desulfobacterales bacterium]|jgi:TRAP-type mannitol/chloroaromatic compound transport system permease small subunit|nr:C4-dicarboxylate ABC transporter permease [Desulfobacter sp.]MDP6394914.1 TRAP transporter small permease subunit [Desulfobacterales bacterium]MDP6682420.1 TRAP transporter small permease subunit [Desulfobacterales bacterium]MDP6807171.1 TRAP transporter small permease subunit [Desulfobacterales bacterium]|tara:strand:+ start:69 stop:596 length:528 start_codon:yes stop_codon:yes gene_type:complete